MDIVTAVKEDTKILSKVMIKTDWYKKGYIHRKPIFKNGSVYVNVRGFIRELIDYTEITGNGIKVVYFTVES